MRVFLLLFLMSFRLFAAESYADVIDKTKHSVVTVHTEIIVNNFESVPAFPFLEEFNIKPPSSLGSGVVIDDKKGYVVTNYHVVREADNISISIHDDYDEKIPATLVGFDSETDLAILQVSSAILKKAQVGKIDLLILKNCVWVMLCWLLVILLELVKR